MTAENVGADQGGEAPCFAHLLGEAEPVTDALASWDRRERSLTSSSAEQRSSDRTGPTVPAEPGSRAVTRRRRRIEVRRVYESAGEGDGYRVLVDRLWPRGVTKAELAADEWLKDAAPSTELRRWYGHELSRFEDFARRYRAELRRSPAAAAVEHLASIAARRRVFLLTATRDVEHSGAEVLRRHLIGSAPPAREDVG